MDLNKPMKIPVKDCRKKNGAKKKDMSGTNFGRSSIQCPVVPGQVEQPDYKNKQPKPYYGGDEDMTYEYSKKHNSKQKVYKY